MTDSPLQNARFKSTFSRERVLVTGAGGFIGANLVRVLLRAGADVWCLTRRDSVPWRLRDVEEKIHLLPIGLGSLPALRSALLKIRPTVIYHLAAYGNSSFHRSVSRMIAVNIQGTENLLRASSEIDYRSLIHTGSSSEYGFQDHPVLESELPEPMSHYAVCKLAATDLCRFYARMKGQPTLTLRLFSVYGPWEDPRRFIPTAIRAALDSRPLPLTAGDESHDYIYVDDVVEALLKAAGVRKPDGRIINICGGRQWTNLEVVHEIERVLKKKIDLRMGEYPARSWDSAVWVGDQKRAAGVLKWKLRTRLAEGIKITAAWIQAHRDQYPPGGKV